MKYQSIVYVYVYVCMYVCVYIYIYIYIKPLVVHLADSPDQRRFKVAKGCPFEEPNEENTKYNMLQYVILSKLATSSFERIPACIIAYDIISYCVMLYEITICVLKLYYTRPEKLAASPFREGIGKVRFAWVP